MTGAKQLRALTPKEFSDAIGGLLSADTVRAKCQSGEFQTVSGPGRPPYFIRPSVLAKFRCDLSRFLVSA